MKDTPARYAKVRTLGMVVGVAAILGGFLMVGAGFAPGNKEDQVWLSAAGGLGVILGLFAITWTVLLIKIESNSFRLYNELFDLHELCRKQHDQLTKIAENSVLSDAAKSMANREEEVETVRRAIHADLRMEKWDAARHLVEELERRFGFAEEADTLRSEINEVQIDAMRQKLDEAAGVIANLLDKHEWDKALVIVERLHKALPDEPRVTKLKVSIEDRRNDRKTELLATWDKAVRREDVDDAISVLQELDAYLTREEARSLEASARDIFKAKLLQLGMQFQFAVTEKRWRDALEVGVQITEEFPNSQMAREVLEAMDGLRKRAGLHGDVEVTSNE